MLILLTVKEMWISRYGVSGYPTLKFFPKENKEGEDYNGGRDVDAFIAFINERTGTNRNSKGQLTQEVILRLGYLDIVKNPTCTLDFSNCL